MEQGKMKAVQDASERITTLSRALTGWQTVLQRVDDLYASAETSSIIKPITNLVPQALLTDKAGNDNVRFINGSQSPNANALREINAFSFVGGGSSITYVEDESVETEDSTTYGISASLTRSLNIYSKVKISSVDFAGSATAGLSFDTDFSSASGRSSRVTSARSFTLSDPDVGDSFDVKVMYLFQ
jgi:hypothetical protein